MTALLLLDVDGVLNALADDGEHECAWPHWRSGVATADGCRWPITWAPAVVARLRGWHEQGCVGVQWLTTWGHEANHELRCLLGLPHLPVAGTYTEFEAEGVTLDAAAGTHAGVAPSAPDPLSGEWWKYDAVRRVLDQHPDRPVIWVDDELHDHASVFRQWAEAHPDVLPVGPDPMVGLVGDDLDRIQTFTQSPEKRSSRARPEGCTRRQADQQPDPAGRPGRRSKDVVPTA